MNHLDDPTIDSIEELRTRPRRLWVDLAGFADDARIRPILARLLRDEEIFRHETHIYLRDVYDCTVQLMDMVDTTRELAASLVEIHLSISANRTNEVMKTLTIMASIFIPLTFIAGIYGMNFEHMPELAHPWAYFAVLGFMAAVAGGLLLWFWRRGWVGWRDE